MGATLESVPTTTLASTSVRAGASRVYWLRVRDTHMTEGLAELGKHVPPHTSIVCESNTIRKAVHPGLFLMVKDARTDACKTSARAVADLADLAPLTSVRVHFARPDLSSATPGPPKFDYEEAYQSGAPGMLQTVHARRRTDSLSVDGRMGRGEWNDPALGTSLPRGQLIVGMFNEVYVYARCVIQQARHLFCNGAVERTARRDQGKVG